MVENMNSFSTHQSSVPVIVLQEKPQETVESQSIDDLFKAISSQSNPLS